MASTTTPVILGLCRALDAAVDKVVAGPDPLFLSPEGKKQALVEISRQSERLDAP